MLDRGDLAAYARLLLQRYYDRLYDKHLQTREGYLDVTAAEGPAFDAGAVADAVLAALAAGPPLPAPDYVAPPPPPDEGNRIENTPWCALS